MQVASARQDEFVFTGFLACFWFWEKAITKKRMAILVKETKIKTSSLSLTLGTGNKSLDCSIIFFIIRENKNSKQKMVGIYLITTLTLMTAVTGKLNMPINDFHSRNAYLILLHGCSFVEDFNNFRLCGSAASHANTKLLAAKYMT